MLIQPSSPLSSRRSIGAPALISATGDMIGLERIRLGEGAHKEKWLQSQLFRMPDLLPIIDIEPGFDRPVSVAMEVPCAHGYIDNLYLTPSGDIVIVEAKLWKNPEARREVIAQTLDYAAALRGMSFDAFEGMCRKGVREGEAVPRLYELVRQLPDALEERQWTDAVTLNLLRGRMLVIAAADGIRHESEALADLLQSDAGAHFTFALVELAIWRNGVTGDLLIVPSTLAQTVMVIRGVVMIENGVAAIKSAPVTEQLRPGSITQEQFYEALALRAPELPQAIRDFIERVEPLGIHADFRKSLVFRAELPDVGRTINLGYVEKSGRLWTDYVSRQCPAHAAMTYLQTIAGLVGGNYTAPFKISIGERSAPFIDALLPMHAGALAEAMSDLLIATRQAVEGKPPPDIMPFADRYEAGLPVMGIVHGQPRSPVLGFVRLEDGFGWCDDGFMERINPGNAIHIHHGPVTEYGGCIRCGPVVLMPIDESNDYVMHYWEKMLEKVDNLDQLHAALELEIMSQAG